MAEADRNGQFQKISGKVEAAREKTTAAWQRPATSWPRKSPTRKTKPPKLPVTSKTGLRPRGTKHPSSGTRSAASGGDGPAMQRG